MRKDVYLNGQHFNNFLLTPLSMNFTERGNPIVNPVSPVEIPKEEIGWIPFNYVPAGKSTDKWVHFYIQDYLFDRVWNHPDKYVEMLKRHPGVVGPDFSMFRDTPYPIQQWSHYKRQWLEAYWQINGIKVIPNVMWSDEKSFEWCFDGVPNHSVISISANGCLKDRYARSLFFRGYIKAQEVLKPKLILIHCAKNYQQDVEAETSFPAKYIHYEFRKRG